MCPYSPHQHLSDSSLHTPACVPCIPTYPCLCLHFPSHPYLYLSSPLPAPPYTPLSVPSQDPLVSLSVTYPDLIQDVPWDPSLGPHQDLSPHLLTSEFPSHTAPQFLSCDTPLSSHFLYPQFQACPSLISCSFLHPCGVPSPPFWVLATVRSTPCAAWPCWCPSDAAHPGLFSHR